MAYELHDLVPGMRSIAACPRRSRQGPRSPVTNRRCPASRSRCSQSVGDGTALAGSASGFGTWDSNGWVHR